MDMSVFERRRRGVMQLMGDGIAIIPSGAEVMRNRICNFTFRPDSDFYYLTHFPEPDAVAVLIPNREQGEFILFCRENNKKKESMDGFRTGLDKAISLFGADDTFPFDDIDEILPGLLENRSRVYTSMGRFPDFDSKLISWVNKIRTRGSADIHAPSEFVSLELILHELRLIKKVEEIRLLRRAAKISAAAHRRAMIICRPGMYEYQIQAEIEHEFMHHGGYSPAYPSIVAAGKNAGISHYVRNRDVLKDGELLTIDAGVEVDCYASDVSRTFPINGRFSAAQRTIYEITLQAQLDAIDAIHKGAKWNEPHEAAVRTICQGLVDIGLLTTSVSEAMELGLYRRFYRHRTGHWLGLDIHDVGDYQVDNTWRLLEPGMVMTVEPCLYIGDEDDIHPRWHHIGTRIEDDVLVTKTGNEVLSADVPKNIADIEQLMSH